MSREVGMFDFSLASTTRNQSSSQMFSDGEELERRYGVVSIEVLEAGEGTPEFRLGPDDAVLWTVVLDEPVFSGLDWVPLYKRLDYSVEIQGGDTGGATSGGQPIPGRPEDGSPHGFFYTYEGQVAAIGLQSRRGLREGVIESVKRDVSKSLGEALLKLGPASNR